MSVDHRAILTQFRILTSLHTTATVTGNKEVARVGGLVFALTLAPTIRHDEYDGLRLRTIHPAAGELDCTRFTFAEFDLTQRRSAQHKLQRVTPYNWQHLLDGVDMTPIQAAVSDHIQAFTG
jgi:hypothetical protein